MSKLRLLIAAVLLFTPAFGSTLYLVVPNAQTSTAGNGAGDISGIADVDIRYQEIFGSGQFSSVPGSMLIDQLAWRAAPGTGAVSATFTSLDLYLSTTPYFPNTSGTVITDTFATNIGPDNTLVYSGAVTLSSAGCAGPSPCPFDLVFLFSTPFLYNPTQGRLLADFQVTGFTGVSGAFDAQSFGFPPGGSIASVQDLLGSATGTFPSDGNITRFGYDLVVPEPATWPLVLGGIGAFAAIRRRRKI